MKKKKFLRAFVSTLLVGSMALTGCGKKDDDKKEDKTTAAPTTEATQSGNNDTTEATSESGGAGYDECTITFDWWGGDSRHEATQAAVDAFMKKYPGIPRGELPGREHCGEAVSVRARLLEKQEILRKYMIGKNK